MRDPRVGGAREGAPTYHRSVHTGHVHGSSCELDLFTHIEPVRQLLIGEDLLAQRLDEPTILERFLYTPAMG